MEPVDPDVEARVLAWMRDDPDPEGRAALAALLSGSSGGTGPERSTALGPPPRFGTSGVRGRFGPGPGCVNTVTARRLAAGVVEVLGSSPTVVVGGDARHGSAEMVAAVAAVVRAAGGQAVVAADPTPTPLLAFAVRHLGADAGVVVTASHNPAPDNGVKVYGPDGLQVVAPTDEAIAAALARPLPGHLRDRSPGGRAAPLPPEVTEAYRAMAGGLVAPDAPRRTRVVLTSLHGCAGTLARDVLVTAGFEVLEVESQARPDPDFPTVPAPNPEAPGVLSAAIHLATTVAADLVLAHDPDGDRLAVAVPLRDDPTAWRPLSGNEVGALLCDDLCARRTSGGRVGDRPGVVSTTVVSTALIGRIAAAHGCRLVVTPTGFKWIMRASLDPSTCVVFGFEEALGYAVTDAVRDKDGITAGLVVADLADRLGPGGLLRRLDELAEQHGRHVTTTVHHRFADADGPTAPAAAMDRLRGDPPHELAGERVVAVVDHADDAIPSDLVELRTSSGATVRVRPSGTEPILKVYAEVVTERGAVPGATPDAGERRLGALIDALSPWVRGPRAGHG